MQNNSARVFPRRRLVGTPIHHHRNRPLSFLEKDVWFTWRVSLIRSWCCFHHIVREEESTCCHALHIVVGCCEAAASTRAHHYHLPPHISPWTVPVLPRFFSANAFVPNFRRGAAGDPMLCSWHRNLRSPTCRSAKGQDSNGHSLALISVLTALFTAPTWFSTRPLVS